MRISDWSSDVCYSDLIAIACAHRVELLDPVGHAAGEDARRRGADFLRLGDHVGAIAFEAHLKGDGYAILVGDRYREAEADDQKIDLRAGGGERRDPAALARHLETEARYASARNPARFGERGDGIAGEPRTAMRIFVAR